MCRGAPVIARHRSPSRWADRLAASVPVRRLAAACACALALALPGQALAQGGAGDQQYTDPFGSQQATPTPAPRPAATAAPAPVATAAPPAAPAAAAPASSRQLPYTG